LFSGFLGAWEASLGVWLAGIAANFTIGACSFYVYGKFEAKVGVT